METTSSHSSPKKSAPYPQIAKELLVKVFEGLQGDFPDLTKSQVLDKLKSYTGVSTRTIERFVGEKKRSATLEPPKKRTKDSYPTITIDDHHKYLIRRIVHGFFAENRNPTITAIHAEVGKCTDIPQMSRSTLHKILREDLKFKYDKRHRRSVLIERPEIIVWRRKFLREIRAAREAGKPIFFLDETWVNAGHTQSKVWHDTTILSPRDAFTRGLSTGLKNPSGKGARLIVLHIGSSEGFLDDGLLLFEGVKTGDYHDEMNAARFEEWFDKILDKLPDNAVIVMDNAPYHSRVLDKVPTMASRKQVLQEWLSSKGIPWEQNMVKAELMKLVSLHKPPKQYVVDSKALAKQKTVLRLPPYHCELNPIELVWGFVKNHVAANNTTYKFDDVRELLINALGEVTATQWQKSIEHVKEEEQKMWDMDHVRDVTVDELVIHVTGDSSSDEWSDSDSDTDKENTL